MTTNYIRLSNGQIIRGNRETGEPLPHGESRAVARAARSKYAPHTGRKQTAKALQSIMGHMAG